MFFNASPRKCVEHDGIDAEDVEELLEEALRLRLLVICALPAVRELGGVLAYLVPALHCCVLLCPMHRPFV